MKVFRIGYMSGEKVAKNMFRLSVITFALYIMHRIIKYEMPWLFYMNDYRMDLNLKQMITHWYFVLRAYIPPIIVLGYLKLLSEAICKILNACEKYVNEK